MTSTRAEGLAAAMLGLLLMLALAAPLCLSHLERTRPVAPAAHAIAQHLSAQHGSAQHGSGQLPTDS